MCRGSGKHNLFGFFVSSLPRSFYALFVCVSCSLSLTLALNFHLFCFSFFLFLSFIFDAHHDSYKIFWMLVCLQCTTKLHSNSNWCIRCLLNCAKNRLCDGCTERQNRANSLIAKEVNRKWLSGFRGKLFVVGSLLFSDKLCHEQNKIENKNYLRYENDTIWNYRLHFRCWSHFGGVFHEIMLKKLQLGVYQPYLRGSHKFCDMATDCFERKISNKCTRRFDQSSKKEKRRKCVPNVYGLANIRSNLMK